MARAKLHVAAFPDYVARRIMPGMSGPYLKQWRKHRGYTQNQVVERLAAFEDPQLPATAASLSRFENGKQPYGQRILEALANIYQCEPDHLIGRDPTKAGEIIDLWQRMTLEQRNRAKAVLQALQKDVS